MRLGIFGGTFDPIHVGHLVAAINARHTLELDKVLLVVANVPWQKAGERAVTPAAQRLELVRAAVGEADGLEASAIEIERGGDSFTADTVAQLQRSYPGVELFLVIGADVVSGLRSWERIEAIRDEVTMVVVNRPGASMVDLNDAALEGFSAVAIEVPALEVSSTDLRQRARTGRPLDFLIPEAAIRVIRSQGLYAVDR